MQKCVPGFFYAEDGKEFFRFNFPGMRHNEGRETMTKGNIYRDVTLRHIGESDIGKEIRVAGWIENIRDHGGVSFVDLRDMYGVLQVVMRDTSLLEGLSREMSVSI